jgi:hypothetical protein
VQVTAFRRVVDVPKMKIGPSVVERSHKVPDIDGTGVNRRLPIGTRFRTENGHCVPDLPGPLLNGREASALCPCDRIDESNHFCRLALPLVSALR